MAMSVMGDRSRRRRAPEDLGNLVSQLGAARVEAGVGRAVAELQGYVILLRRSRGRMVPLGSWWRYWRCRLDAWVWGRRRDRLAARVREAVAATDEPPAAGTAEGSKQGTQQVHCTPCGVRTSREGA